MITRLNSKLYIAADSAERDAILLPVAGEQLFGDPEGTEVFVQSENAFYKWVDGGYVLIPALPALAGNANKLVKVKSDETGFEYVSAGSGSGDMIAANNLSDVASVNTSLNNLGVNVKFSATEDIAAYLPVTSTGKAADSANSAHRGKVIGINTAAVLNGFIGYVKGQGTIKNVAWAWTVGDKIFLNGTALSTVAPSTGFSQLIGVAVASDTIDVNLGPAILL